MAGCNGIGSELLHDKIRDVRGKRLLPPPEDRVNQLGAV